VREIRVLHTADIRAILLRRKPDGTWPDNTTALAPGVSVTLESIDFTAPLAAFYPTADDAALARHAGRIDLARPPGSWVDQTP
jgi:hypothetical protein